MVIRAQTRADLEALHRRPSASAGAARPGRGAVMALTPARRRRRPAAIAAFLIAALVLLVLADSTAAATGGGVVGGLISTVAATADDVTGHEVLPVAPAAPSSGAPSEAVAPPASALPAQDGPQPTAAGLPEGSPANSAPTGSPGRDVPLLARRRGGLEQPAAARRDPRAPAATADGSARVRYARAAHPPAGPVSGVTGAAVSLGRRVAGPLAGGAPVEALLQPVPAVVEALPGAAGGLLTAGTQAELLLGGLLGGPPTAPLIPAVPVLSLQSLTEQAPDCGDGRSRPTRRPASGPDGGRGQRLGGRRRGNPAGEPGRAGPRSSARSEHLRGPRHPRPRGVSAGDGARRARRHLLFLLLILSTRSELPARTGTGRGARVGSRRRGRRRGGGPGAGVAAGPLRARTRPAPARAPQGLSPRSFRADSRETGLSRPPREPSRAGRLSRIG